MGALRWGLLVATAPPSGAPGPSTSEWLSVALLPVDLLLAVGRVVHVLGVPRGWAGEGPVALPGRAKPRPLCVGGGGGGGGAGAGRLLSCCHAAAALLGPGSRRAPVRARSRRAASPPGWRRRGGPRGRGDSPYLRLATSVSLRPATGPRLCWFAGMTPSLTSEVREGHVRAWSDLHQVPACPGGLARGRWRGLGRRAVQRLFRQRTIASTIPVLIT